MIYRIEYTLHGKQQCEYGTLPRCRALADWLMCTFRITSRIVRTS